jgi:hypothetical protein
MRNGGARREPIDQVLETQPVTPAPSNALDAARPGTDLILVLLRFSFLNPRQVTLPVNGVAVFGYIKVLRQDWLAADGALEG